MAHPILMYSPENYDVLFSLGYLSPKLDELYRKKRYQINDESHFFWSYADSNLNISSLIRNNDQILTLEEMIAWLILPTSEARDIFLDSLGASHP